jgi:UDP-4-amino-4-deoxy-L-arabinose formyltransferase/UDP-glucuronic acid dehydrogenase (UDP-4-keto-hexauronic acid decarboxylating)
LAAEESAGIQTLKWLARDDHEIVAVMAAEPGGDTRVATVAGVARNLELPLWAPELVRDPALAARVREQRVDLLLNVHSLFIVHGDVLAAPRIGSFNLHPGPLPHCAGLNTPSWAIYLGERRHGVSVHWMEPEIDTGPIAFQATFDIEPTDTGLSVSAKCARHGMPLLEELVAAAEKGADSIPAIEQDLSKRHYYGAEVPNEGRIDWRQPARRVVDFVRACDYSPFSSPWSHAKASIDGAEVAIVKASLSHEQCAKPPGTVGRTGDEGVMVAAGDEWIVVERMLVDGDRGDPSEVLVEGRRFSARPGKSYGDTHRLSLS